MGQTRRVVRFSRTVTVTAEFLAGWSGGGRDEVDVYLARETTASIERQGFVALSIESEWHQFDALDAALGECPVDRIGDWRVRFSAGAHRR